MTPHQRLTEFFTTGIPVYLIFRRSVKLSSLIHEGAAEAKRLVAAVRRGGVIAWSALMRQSFPKQKKKESKLTDADRCIHCYSFGNN